MHNYLLHKQEENKESNEKCGGQLVNKIYFEKGGAFGYGPFSKWTLDVSIC